MVQRKLGKNKVFSRLLKNGIRVFRMTEKRLHVLVIAQLFPPDMGGGATRALNIVKGLIKAGCDVTVIAAFPHYPHGKIPQKYRGKPLVVESIGRTKIIRTYVPPLPSVGFTRRLVLFLSFMFSSLFALPFIGRITAVWAANPNILSVYSAIPFSLLKRCPIIQNVDDLWPEELYDLGMMRSKIIRQVAEFFSKIAYTISAKITPISPLYIKTIVKKYRISPKKIHLIPTGVDLSYFSDNEKVKKRKHVFEVLYIGAFSIAYNFDQVLLAAKILEEYPEIKIVLQGDGELFDILKFKTGQLGLSNVELINKIIERREVAKRLGEADVLLLPLSGLGSIEMGLSTKIYEYQAAGKPIVCCSSGVPGRYISTTRSGIVVKPGDHEALAKAILKLYRNPELAREMGENGKRYVEANLTIEKIGQQMKSIIKAIST